MSTSRLLVLTVSALTLAIVGTFFLLAPHVRAQSIGQLPGFISSTTPVDSITQRIINKPVRITGLTGGLCLKLDANNVITTTTCGGSGIADPFTHLTIGGQAFAATSTGLQLTGSPLGLVASSTSQLATTTIFTQGDDGFRVISTASNHILSLQNTGAGSAHLSVCNSATGCTTSDGTDFGIDATGNARILNHEAAGFRFLVNGTTEAFDILSGGNVGIGTTTPTKLLSVQGSGIFAGDVSLASLNATGTITTALGSGIVKSSSGVLGLGANGTDYTLITAKTCTTGDFVSAITAAGVFTCTTPSGSGITAIGPVGQTQTGATLTIASSTSTTNGLVSAITVVGSGNTLTFTPSTSGTLTVPGGGTGAATLPSGQLLYGAGTAAVQSVATSSHAFSTGGFATTGTLGALVSGTASTVKQLENRSWSYATTSWTGTTTIPLGVGYGETWNNLKCYTDVGTLNLDFYYASTHMLNPVVMNASTTAGTVSVFSNATPTAGNKLQVDVGTPASAPTKISCTVNDSN